MGNFPSLEEVTLYLTDELGSKPSSVFKSRYSKITRTFNVIDFTRENVRVFLNRLRTEERLKSSTLNKYLGVLKTVAHYMKTDILDNYKGYKVMESDTKPLGDMLSDRQMRAICEVYIARRDERATNLRYGAALTLMRFSGMPPVDLTHLKWENDNLTHFEYYRAKTGKHMRVPIVPEVRRLLDKLERFPHHYVFGSSHGRLQEQSLNSEIKRRCKVLKLKGHFTSYSFRYSMITACYVTGGESMIPKIAEISGHTINTAMKHYVKFDVQVLTDALYATHPGLIRKAPIDIIKRTITKILEHLIDVNKYQVDLTITPKVHNVRRITLS